MTFPTRLHVRAKFNKLCTKIPHNFNAKVNKEYSLKYPKGHLIRYKNVLFL